MTHRSIAILQSVQPFFRWWGEGLLQSIPASVQARLFHRPDRVIVLPEPSRLRIRILDGANGTVRAEHFQSLEGNDTVTELRQWLKDQSIGDALPVSLIWPREKIAHRDVWLPPATDADLRKALLLDLDRLTPFTPEQVNFSVQMLEHDPESGRIRVRMDLIRRDQLELLLDELRGLALEVDGVYAGDDINLERNLLPVEWQPKRNHAAERHTLALAAGALISLLAWLYLPLWHQSRLLDEWQERLEISRADALETQKLEASLRMSHARSRFIASKRVERPPLIEVLKELTVRIPDQAWVQQASLQGQQLHISGEAQSAAALLALLEESPLFENVELRSPMSQNETTGDERFNYRLKIASPLP